MRTLCIALTAMIPLFSALHEACLAQESNRIVLLAGKPSHGFGSHEHLAGCRILADTIERGTNGKVKCEVYSGGWPEDDKVLDGAKAIVMYCDGGGNHPALQHLPKLGELMDQGVGFVCIHYAVEVPADRGGREFLNWLGGYFETHWSVNPHWLAKYDHMPDHPVTHGVKPFEAKDEWYFHMRFQPAMKGVTPILSAIAPEDTMRRPDGPHSGNPAVRKEVAEQIPQHTAWTYDRPNGGRSFGFTGGHFHWNWGREDLLRLVCNAILWTAKIEVDKTGLPLNRPSLERLEAGQDFAVPANYKRDNIQREFRLVSRSKDARQNDPSASANDPRSPAQALSGLKVHPDVVATLAAAEPTLQSLSCLDVDHRGRVWVCEVVNYRGHNGKRPEGDRVLILEDEDGDGVMDTSKIFHQGNDIDSAMGICVLGNRVIVSATPNIWIFTDENGDDIPDRQELLFSKTGQPQHDHSAHSFIFGPDGKLYWNFGNTGKAVHDAQGNVVTDLAGNQVVDNGRPYYGGMVFRCNIDGSEFETLAHNFRNNYEVTVDSFGTIWQSDNDDDGNKATRINYVMDYGNYGYLDQLTGAGWRTSRINLEKTVPEQHWHLNDPGVVPTMLITGAGSPCGIMVYEGDLLPPVFRNQVIHCDPGPNALRAYPTSRDGAGYAATIENILTAGTDNWFRPVDVCTAPDGSLYCVDWYDPGVGGHQMGDLERGRLYRIAPDKSKYSIRPLDLSSPENAVAALASPNQATRYMAWQAILSFGKSSRVALEKMARSENARLRSRALWVLAKVVDDGSAIVSSALADVDPDVRCMGIRLARQLKRTPASYAKSLIDDASAAVRRELALALRFDSSEEMPSIWAELAAQYDGKDRWYLEALGIGAELRWSQCFQAYEQLLDRTGRQVNFDIAWRSRSELSLPHLEKSLLGDGISESQILRALRSLEYHPAQNRQDFLASLIDKVQQQPQWNSATELLVVEALMQLPDANEKGNHSRIQSAILNQLKTADRSRQLRILKSLAVEDASWRLIALASHEQMDTTSLDAAELLIDRNDSSWQDALRKKEDPQALRLAEAIAAAKNATPMLKRLVNVTELDAPIRLAIAKGLARTPAGAQQLLEMAQSGTLPSEARFAIGSLLRSHRDDAIKSKAAELFPVPATKSKTPLSPLVQLLKRNGDAVKGGEVYKTTGTCAKCHQLGSEGKNVGPNLSEIGSKLAKEALYVAILDPSAGISHNYESYSALTDSGQIITGLLISQTDAEVVLRDAEGIDRTLKRAELEEFKKQSKSLMPENIMEALTEDDLVNLVEYLQTLRKAG